MTTIDRDTKIAIVTVDERIREVLQFCFEGWGYKVFLYDSSLKDITPIKKLSPHVIVVDVQSAHKQDLALCRLLKDDFATSMIPVITIINKRYLREHLLNLKHGVDDYVIKPPDPLDLRVRIEMAIRRAHYNLYASSLTGLPGGRIIEETLKERLHGAEPFCFGYIDIDNFKFYNDMYGYQKGDSVILQAAYILYSVARRCGTRSDLIGHIGGDDFVFITTVENGPAFAEAMITDFDRVIPFHYSVEDRRRGFIIARDRTHTIARVPLMSLSIALAKSDAEAPYKNMLEINDRIAGVKRFLKTVPGSKYMLDRRQKVPGQEIPATFPRNQHHYSVYKPLGEILVEKQIMTRSDLDEVLLRHWKKAVPLGDLLRETGVLTEESLRSALAYQRKLQAAEESLF